VDQLLALACANAAKADVANVESLNGEIENVPLPEAAADVVISSCVINLSTDKPAVLAEMFRLLALSEQDAVSRRPRPGLQQRSRRRGPPEARSLAVM
jgi:arsenite methyltransferase